MLADPAIISTGNEISVTESMSVSPGAPTREGALKLWLWDSSNLKCDFFPDLGYTSPSPYASITKVINDAAESAKVFDNGEIIMTGDPAIVSPGNPLSPTSGIDFETENNPLNTVSNAAQTRYRDGVLRFPTRGIGVLDRMRGTWLKMRFRHQGKEKFNIFAMIAKYRKSYN